AAQGRAALGGAEGAPRRGGDLPDGGRGGRGRGHRPGDGPRVVRVGRLVQGRAARGSRGRFHRPHVRADGRQRPAGGGGRGDRRGDRAVVWRRPAPAAVAG